MKTGFNPFDTPDRQMMPTGTVIDMVTGNFKVGRYGDTYINGGIGPITSFVGRGNLGKTTLLEALTLKAIKYVNLSYPTGLSTYDSEDNKTYTNMDRVAKIVSDSFTGMASKIDPDWTLVRKSDAFGDEWMKLIHDFVNKRNKSEDVQFTYDKHRGNTYTAKVPYFVHIDSWTQFESAVTAAISEKSVEDDASGHTLSMAQGKFKTRALSEFTYLFSKANIYLGLTAHIGDSIDMSGMYAPKANKKLAHMKSTENLKGVGSKFTFLTTQLIALTHSQAMLGPDKMPEYPNGLDGDISSDLNRITLLFLRNKNGPSGQVVKVITSQSGGLLDSVTEFDLCKENKRFGISGNLIHYSMDLLPDVKLSRGKLRSTIDKSSDLRRVLKITADLLQLQIYFPGRFIDIRLTPAELYQGIIDKGYDWDEILKTRAVQTPDQYGVKPYCLSTVDLLNMVAGKYIPYWKTEEWKKDNK